MTASSYNPVVPPPTLHILKNGPGYFLDWADEGDGLGLLETSPAVDGDWSVIPGGAPGYPVNLNEPHRFFRLALPYGE